MSITNSWTTNLSYNSSAMSVYVGPCNVIFQGGPLHNKKQVIPYARYFEVSRPVSDKVHLVPDDLFAEIKPIKIQKGYYVITDRQRKGCYIAAWLGWE